MGKKTPISSFNKGPMDMHDYKAIENQDKIIKYAQKEKALTGMNNTSTTQMFSTQAKTNNLTPMNERMRSTKENISTDY